MPNRFLDKLHALLDQGRAPLCVGLDPTPEGLPPRYPDLLSWNRAIIEATADLAACYKPNIAFYEALGREGFDLLADTLAALPPDVPVLLDAKRGDIGSTAAAYARACFEVWNADAVTVSPFLGEDSVRPFTAYADRYVFVLCHTSNPGAADFQHLTHGGQPLYERIAAITPRWGDGNVGLVVGATYPQALAEVRALAPDAWLLAPGVGAQGGEAGATLAHGADANGRGVLINASRGIAQAADPRQAAEALAQQMRPPIVRPPTAELSRPLQTLALRLHEIGCVQFGEFTLASGVQSPVYVDLRLLVSHPPTLALAAQVYARLIADVPVQRLAGVPYAALPIATAVALESGLPLIYPRKEAKQHGRGRLIEGEFEAGDRVVVIEDLVTSAGSLIASIEALREAGLVVSDAVVLIDREQGGSQNLAAAGVRLHAAFTFTQLLDALHGAGRITSAQYETVRGYLVAL